MTRQLHSFSGKFTTVEHVKKHIHGEFEDVLHSSSSDNINVGYFDGRQSVKMSLMSIKDIEAMYRGLTKSRTVFLWVESCEEIADALSCSIEKKNVKRNRDMKKRRRLKTFIRS